MVIQNRITGISACLLLGALCSTHAAFSGAASGSKHLTFSSRFFCLRRFSTKVYISTFDHTGKQSRNDGCNTPGESTEEFGPSISGSANCNSYNNKELLLSSFESSRRAAFLQMLALATFSTTLPVAVSSASEIDSSGSMFSPKTEMIGGGGSVAARGIPLKQEQGRQKEMFAKTGPIQNVYETRFITYLARFLIVYDPAARGWWKQKTKIKALTDPPDLPARFSEFAESVEVGLADYFIGPYGSYASVAAAKAGINAVAPAKSARGPEKPKLSNLRFGVGSGRDVGKTSPRKAKKKAQDETKRARKGVLNLFSLLKARYTAVEEKQQLAILFSLISSPELQPVNQIRSLLGEVDNGTIASIELLQLSDETDEVTNFRSSSRLGGGFALEDTKVVSVESPPPLGDEYKPAKIQAMMKPTTRILRINVIDGGEGYTVAPDIVVKPRGTGVLRRCDACAIIDRKGSVSEIIVLDPGFGYGGKENESIIPTVEIRERMTRQSEKQNVVPAKAVAELEYKVTGVKVLDGGSGYLFDQPPEISLNLPDCPDWSGTPTVQGLNNDYEENLLIAVRVSKMRSNTGDITIDTSAVRRGKAEVTIVDEMLQKIQSDPIALLPYYIRPQFTKFTADGDKVIRKGYYTIPSLPAVPKNSFLPSALYRSIDPLFGGVGKAPVTKNALKLSPGQYSRLALSGAICTVLVRTALNPLELVKTKIQLGNDEEIIQLAKEIAAKKNIHVEEAESLKMTSRIDTDHAKHGANLGNAEPPIDETEKLKIGTMDVVKSLIEIRGPSSLFQSADITFYTSIVFGIFGFGATELFRRSFSAVFFDEASAGSETNELLLLAAAALGTVLTCAAGAPFEILRVRSMSQVEARGAKAVLQDFVEENRRKKQGPELVAVSMSNRAENGESLGLQLEDVQPLWSSFNPIISRELPFAVTKFLVFDLAAQYLATLVNAQLGDGSQVQVGVGSLGLLLSAIAGALAGLTGAFISHPADLILTLTSTSSKDGDAKDWKDIVKDLLDADGGILNLYAGFSARAVFFFLVIGLQFFLYDYIKTLLDVGTDDLTLVLDVFYAVRQGLL